MSRRLLEGLALCDAWFMAGLGGKVKGADSVWVEIGDLIWAACMVDSSTSCM